MLVQNSVEELKPLARDADAPGFVINRLQRVR